AVRERAGAGQRRRPLPGPGPGGDVHVTSPVERHYEAVLAAGDAFFAAHAEALASACWGMARRFHAGGRLVIHGPAGAAFSDAQHNAVEFVHPVLVGKRALPAIAVRGRAHLDVLVRAGDIRMEIGERGFEVDGEAFAVATGDARVAQEVIET